VALLKDRPRRESKWALLNDETTDARELPGFLKETQLQARKKGAPYLRAT